MLQSCLQTSKARARCGAHLVVDGRRPRLPSHRRTAPPPVRAAVAVPVYLDRAARGAPVAVVELVLSQETAFFNDLMLSLGVALQAAGLHVPFTHAFAFTPMTARLC